MRLNIRTKNNYSYYTIIKDYTNLNGKRTTTVFEKLGNQQQIEERFGKVNTIENIKKYINQLNNESKENILNVQFDPNKTIEKNIKKRFNIGYLFLKKIYNELKIKDICEEIENKYQFKFDLNEIDGLVKVSAREALELFEKEEGTIKAEIIKEQEEKNIRDEQNISFEEFHVNEHETAIERYGFIMKKIIEETSNI